MLISLGLCLSASQLRDAGIKNVKVLFMIKVRSDKLNYHKTKPKSFEVGSEIRNVCGKLIRTGRPKQ